MTEPVYEHTQVISNETNFVVDLTVFSIDVKPEIKHSITIKPLAKWDTVFSTEVPEPYPFTINTVSDSAVLVFSDNTKLYFSSDYKLKNCNGNKNILCLNNYAAIRNGANKTTYTIAINGNDKKNAVK